MQKGKKRLQALKEKLMPANVGFEVMSNAIKMMLPQLGETIEKMEKPEKDGGLLNENEQKVAFVIVQTTQGTKLTINTLKRVEEGMLITRTISDQPLENIFDHDESNESE